MGKFGSGRLASKKRIVVEDCFNIDVNKLYKLGGIGVVRSYELVWKNPQSQEVITEMMINSDIDSLILIYKAINQVGNDKVEIKLLIKIEWVKAYLGGSRPYFICPDCKRRASKLYRPTDSQRFLCRHCWSLTYQSRIDSNDNLAVALNKINRLKKKLKWGCGAEDVTTESSPLPTRPKGQHKRTYQKIIEQIAETEEAAKNIMMDIYKNLTGEGVDGN